MKSMKKIAPWLLVLALICRCSGSRSGGSRSHQSGIVRKEEKIQRLQEAQVEKIPGNIQTENRLRLS
jgi:hypothetical protein